MSEALHLLHLVDFGQPQCGLRQFQMRQRGNVVLFGQRAASVVLDIEQHGMPQLLYHLAVAVQGFRRERFVEVVIDAGQRDHLTRSQCSSQRYASWTFLRACCRNCMTWSGSSSGSPADMARQHTRRSISPASAISFHACLVASSMAFILRGFVSIMSLSHQDTTVYNYLRMSAMSWVYGT